LGVAVGIVLNGTALVISLAVVVVVAQSRTYGRTASAVLEEAF
jgi:hypothetical protein